jgi:glycosyltransferase involved in cell wall biosynthesis
MEIAARERALVPILSVVTPCFNEAHSIAAYLDGVERALHAAGLAGRFEIIVGDGMSTDGTRQWLAEAQRTRPWLRVVDNPQRKTPCGRNAAIQASRGQFIAIVDAHWQLPVDYFRLLLPALDDPGIGAVGGICRSLGDGGFRRRLIAAAFESPFATGAAMRSEADAKGEWSDVDSVPGGVLRREVLRRVGLFDPRLWRNQDDEFMLRLRAYGLRVVQNRRVKVGYRTRGQFHRLFRQYYEYGYYKRYALRAGRWGKAQYLTLGLVAYVAAALLLVPVQPLVGLAALAAFPLTLTVVEMSWRAAHGKRASALVVIPVLVMQLGYGIGLWAGLLAGRRHPVAQPAQIPPLEA